jgi:cytochrome c5
MKKVMACAVAAALMTVAGAASAERSGEELYNSICMTCHASGVAGAPKFQNADDWGPRAAKGIDAMLALAKSGVRAMPPMGTCMDCSDAELKAAIEYMQPK